MKKFNVILTALNGVLFTQRFEKDGVTPKLDKNNKPFGFIRVENPSEIDLGYAYNTGGVKRGQSALISMTVEAWEKNKNLKDAEGKLLYSEGRKIPGRVRVIETTNAEEAKIKGFKPKMAGSAENAQPCLLDGAQIFRGTVFVSQAEIDRDNSLAEDILVQHNNVIVGSNVKAGTGISSLNG